MTEKSLILVGGPDTGKTNFLGRLWFALNSQKFLLVPETPPDDIKYVEDIGQHLLQGRFAARTDKEEAKREFNINVKSKDTDSLAKLNIPDVSGEMWKKAVDSLEIPRKWMSLIENSDGALLFVRVLSDLIVQPMDWVTSKDLLSNGFVEDSYELPTQISLLELLRFLEENLGNKIDLRPKVAIIVSAWDLVNAEDATRGPAHYLEQQFPLFAGRLKDITKLDVKIFGLSIFGGDFSIEEFRKKFFDNDFEDLASVVSENGSGELEVSNDVTYPIDWLIK